MDTLADSEIRIYRALPGTHSGTDADPVQTEIVRHSLNSAANQMKRTLIRTSFSPVIYEVLDFAAALYDTKVRLLAQAPSIPLFMGTLNFCVEAAVEGSGGVENLEPGDIILYNWPFGTGSHAQDTAMIQPVFTDDGTLVGYSAIKAHWLDIGAIAPYCTDTTDVFQEGTFFPGVKLYKGGKLVDDIHRFVLANSRMPAFVAGDILAQATAVGVGARNLVRIVDRYGLEVFHNTVERIFDHGEATVRSYFEKIPDGRYVGHGMMDNNGVDDKPIPFNVVVEVRGSSVRVDFTNSPEVQPGPVNCPVASTVSASRVAITMLAGGNQAPCDGHFRPVEIVTRRNSMFDPNPPAPCFLYGWPAMQSMEVIYHAMSKVNPETVPACSGGDLCALVWWGTRQDSGEMWGDGSPFPVGHGGSISGDGSTMMHAAEAATRFASMEVMESKFPWVVEQCQFVPDSCGAGKFRGGMGYDLGFELLEEAYCTPTLERTRTRPWGLAGGGEARANSGTLRYPDGRVEAFTKATGMPVPKGAVLTIHTGGGGGYGPPEQRALEQVEADLKEGYITEAFAREHHADVKTNQAI